MSDNPISRRSTGQLGEKLAADFIRRKGYRIIEKNYRCPEGEIDIVAENKHCLVFVEVRSKTNATFGTPEESVTATKKARLATCALRYLTSHPSPDRSWRIDLVAVELDISGKVTRLEITENITG